jgi:hypothetical protein
VRIILRDIFREAVVKVSLILDHELGHIKTGSILLKSRIVKFIALDVD